MLLHSIRNIDLIGRFYRSNAGKKWVANKLQSVLPHLDTTDSILDIGSGNGLITHTLRKQGYDTTAVDVADLSIIPEVETVVYDGQQLPFADKAVDVALLLTVLHHCTDPVAVLAEALRVAQRVIIIEDIYYNKVQQYLTYGMDTLVNLGHSAMTYQNKSDEEWQKVFEELEADLVATSSKRVLLFFRQATYVIEQRK